MGSNKPSPPAGSRVTQGARATVTNEAELERARLISLEEATGDLLSLANRQSRSPDTPVAVQISSPPQTPSLPRVTRSSRPIQGALEVMRSRLQLDDFSGAIELARAILRRDESNEEAALVVTTCEAKLEEMCRARLGSLDRAPRILVSAEQLRWLSIDHRAGFLLSLVDGTVTIENILDLSGMPRLAALQLLVELVETDIIAVSVG